MKRKILQKFLGVFLAIPMLLFSVHAVYASTYYIDYTNGNDTTGDGATATPYKTLAKALTIAGNNDTIIARTGMYRERNLTISETGLTVQADAGNTPIFVGTTAYASGVWTKTGGQTNVYETAYTDGSCWGVWNGTSEVFASVASVAQVNSTSNSYYFDNAGDKLYVNVGGPAPGDIEVYVGGNQFTFIVTGTGFTLNGLTFQWQMQAVDIRAGGSAIRNCTFRYWKDYLAHPSFGFIKLDGGNHTVDGCSFSGTRTKTIAIAGEPTASGITASNNSGENLYTGVHIQGGSGHLIENNTFHDLYNDGVGMGISPGDTVSGTVRYNVVYNASHGGYRSSGSGTVTYHHNIVYLTGEVPPGATAVTYGFIVDPHANANFYHNLAANTNLESGGDAGYLIQSNGVIVAKNNVSLNNDVGYSVPGGFTPTLTADYNGSYSNTIAYSGGWSQGAHDVTSAPNFVDSSAYDFHLLSTSPYINAGVAVAGISDDYTGTAPDVGRYEHVDPDSPSALVQYRSDGSTNLAIGDLTEETTVVLKFSMSSENTYDSLTPQIEIQQIGTDFTNAPTHSGDAVEFLGTPVVGTVAISGLTKGGQYHWQARIGNTEGESNWIAFGFNTETEADFSVDAETSTILPTPSTSDGPDTSEPKGVRVGLAKNDKRKPGDKTFRVTDKDVKLYFSATDDTGVDKVKVSEHKDFRGSKWEDYDGTRKIELSSSDETKTIYFKFKDEAGNTTKVYEQKIQLDTTPPEFAIAKVGLIDYEDEIKKAIEKKLYYTGQSVVISGNAPDADEVRLVVDNDTKFKTPVDSARFEFPPYIFDTGMYEVALIAEDAHGQMSTEKFTLVIDPTSSSFPSSLQTSKQ